VRLLIDTTYRLRAPFSGTAIYIERLCEELRRHAEVEVIEAANQRRRPPAGGGIGSARNLLSDWRWTARELPRLATAARADLIHHSLPAHTRFTDLPQVITVHDLAFERVPDDFAPAFRRHARPAYRRAARAAAAVICVSETTAQDVQELWAVPKQRIVVAHHGPGQEISASHRDGGDRHFLYVGDDEPRKNVDALVMAYRMYRAAATSPLPLVLAGSLNRSESGILREHNPSRQRLAELYAGAVALIQPSRYEGFGMTALEAMSAGTPVIAASIPALLEICEEAAVYVDPASPQALAVTMARVAADPELQRSLSERGRRRAAHFSWAQSARAHLTAYAMALDRLPSSGP
jgi:glycosyltransferase involved in cell wall biosynthesis